MKTLAIMFFATIATVPLDSHAVECPIPGTTASWATDQCLLETGESNAQSTAVLDCLSKRGNFKDPCEWNIKYKQAYCDVLIRKGMFHGSQKKCVKDPSTIGPTVRSIMKTYGSEA